MAELKRYRCQNCSKTLFFADIKEGTISKNCRCGLQNVFEVKNGELKKPALSNKKLFA